MTLLEQLIQNKGTVSSALGKQLAKDVLNGRTDILKEAIKLLHYDSKNVRSGASKIIEKVAEEKPDLVAENIDVFVEALNYSEPQTRWMMIHTIALCARLKPDEAFEIFDEVIKYLDPKEGTVLKDRAITYLGYIGAISVCYCEKAYPYLIQAVKTCPNRITRIFESIYRMADMLSENLKEELKQKVHLYINKGSPSEKSWAKKLLKSLSD
ncbi:MAG: hypothetical protein JXB17_06400 [Bacteroidales bacterium]|nr:hypothetical protein [Bacteroidales bacterium]